MDERVGYTSIDQNLRLYIVLIGAANGTGFLVSVSGQAWLVLNVEDNESDQIFSESVS